MSEFSDLFGEWASQGVTIHKRLGKNAQGDVWATAGDTLNDVMVEEVRRIVVTSDATQAVSNATIYCEPADLDHFNDKAKVLLPSGRVAKVISIQKLDVFGLIGHGVVNTD